MLHFVLSHIVGFLQLSAEQPAVAQQAPLWDTAERVRYWREVQEKRMAYGYIMRVMRVLEVGCCESVSECGVLVCSFIN